MATTLAAGDIAIVQANADNDDQFAFVLLKNVDATTTISFTDNGWLAAGGFRSGEGTITWTSGAALTAGATIVITAASGSPGNAFTANQGTVASISGSLQFSAVGDQLIAFQGTTASPTVIAALDFANTQGWDADATNSNTSVVPTGLTNGVNAVSVSGDNVVHDYNPNAGTAEALRAEINNAANWIADDAIRQTPPGDYTITGGATETIAIAALDATKPEGNAGTTSFTFTVSRTGPTAGEVTLDYAVTGSGANPAAASDFGGALPAGQVTIPDGSASVTLTINVSGDLDVEANESFTVTLSNAPAGITLATPSAVGVIQPDDLPPVTHQIADIQGKAHVSPFVTAESKTFNQATTAVFVIDGVVTARDTNGFYLQDDTPDADPETSDALFVFTGAAPAASITVGEIVVVQGNVIEFQNFNNLSQTQLTNVIVLETDIAELLPFANIGGTATGRLVPPLTITDDDELTIYDPANDGIDFWESVESMRVIYNDPIVSDGFWFSFGGFYVYSGSVGATTPNDRGGLTISGEAPVDGGGQYNHAGDFNPERIQVDFSESFSAPSGALSTQIDMGDQLEAITGIVKHDFSNWKLFATETPTFKPGGDDPDGPVSETATLQDDPRSLTIATFNVENLDPTDGQARFDAIAQAIATKLNAPDIIVIEEMQDNNGAATQAGGDTDASLTWTTLVDALNLASGKVYQWVDENPVYDAEGGEPSGNIRVGFLYDTGKVQLGDGSLAANAPIEERRKWTDRIGDGVDPATDLIGYSDAALGAEIVATDWAGTRLSLVGQFSFNGVAFYVVGNHWPSKGGSGAQYQLNQDHPANPANADWAARKEIAEDVYLFAKTIQAADPNARVVVAGDLNEFAFFDPLRVVAGEIDADGVARPSGDPRLVNLALTEIADPQERYSFMFDGNAQQLDHILTDAELGDNAAFEIVHINTGINVSRAGSPRVSDHDPLLALFDVSVFGEMLTGDGDADFLYGFGGDDSLIGGVGDDFFIGGTGADSIVGGADDDILVGGAGADTLDGGDGVDVADYDGLAVTIDMLNPSNNAGDAAGDSIVSIETFYLSSGADSFLGAAAGEVVLGAGGADTLNGGDGADTLILGDDGGSLEGGTGADILASGAGDDFLSGGDDNDFLIAGGGDDTLTGGSGDDALLGEAGADSIEGGDGDDSLLGGDDNDTIAGDLGDDYVDAGAGDDSVTAGDGADAVVAGAGADTVLGGAGDQVILGEGGADSVTLGLGSNFVDAGADNDTVIGGAGNDSILGGDGADEIIAGLGFDVLLGGAGADVFDLVSSFNAAAILEADYIADWEAGVDQIRLAAETEADTDFLQFGADVFIATTNGAGIWGVLVANAMLADVQAGTTFVPEMLI